MQPLRSSLVTGSPHLTAEVRRSSLNVTQLRDTTEWEKSSGLLFRWDTGKVCMFRGSTKFIHLISNTSNVFIPLPSSKMDWKGQKTCQWSGCKLRLSPMWVPGREEQVDELWLVPGMMSGHRVDTQAKLLNDWMDNRGSLTAWIVWMECDDVFVYINFLAPSICWAPF